MFVIQVSPLLRGSQLEALSYFSSTPYEIGSFLKVPIRGKLQSAIVTEVRPVSSTKTALKTATFSLRKLPTQENPVVLPKSIRLTAESLTRTYPTSAGSLLFHLLPSDIKNDQQSYPSFPDNGKHDEETIPQILTARHDERMLSYQGLIRSTLAKHKSIMIICPTASEAGLLYKTLQHGIRDRVVIFSPYQTKKRRALEYEKLQDLTVAKLIITTPNHAYLERPDISTMVIEQSASSHFVMRQRPYLDHRESLILLAKITGRSIILGDTVPRTEDEVKRRDETYLTYGEETKRIVFSAPLTIISQKDKPKPDNPFKLFSNELLLSAERSVEAGGHVFLFSARRGLAPVVACVDCGHIFRCPDSNTPYSLIRTEKHGKEERWFVSSTSGRRVRASDVCPHCGSWRLRERGIGIQHAYDEWREKMPHVPAIILDQTTATTGQQAKKIVEGFFATKGGVLLGTQMAIPFLTKKVDVSAIISLDATRSVPTWRADESLFRLLLRLRECTIKEVLVQTRSETDNLLTYASRGAVERFYDDEIALRQMLQYPPYSSFILLTWLGSAISVLESEKTISALLAGFNVQYYNNPNSTPVRTYRHGLLRIATGDDFIYQTVLPKLRSLPPFVKVEINPDRIV
jgi:primosomal protein N'